MPTAIPDLWPRDVFAGSSPNSTATPLAVLRKQGEALGAHTQNFVSGEVQTSAGVDGKQFTHFFMLVAPLLRYRKALLQVNHGLQPYPATVVETELTKQGDKFWSREAKNEQELQDHIREFLNEARVKEILRSVINLSNDVAPLEAQST
jgi:hypothetical protein